MSSFFKHFNNLPHRTQLQTVGLAGAMSVLMLAALFISSGGMHKVDRMLVAANILPDSLTACVFHCNHTTYALEDLTPTVGGVEVSSVAPSTAVQWIWNAGSYGANQFAPVCMGSSWSGSQVMCTVQLGSPNTNFGTCNPAGCVDNPCPLLDQSYSCDKNGANCSTTCLIDPGQTCHAASGCGNADDTYGNACYGAGGGITVTGGQPNCQYWPASGGGGYDGNYPASTLTLTAPTTPGTYTYYFCSSWLITHDGLPCVATPLIVNAPPTPTTFNYFNATPASITAGGSTNLHWSFNPGSSFVGCEIIGGNWPSGYYWLPANDSGVANNTGALAGATTFTVWCYDGPTLGWTAQHTLTVGLTVPPAVSAGITVNTPITVGQTATFHFHADSTTPPACQINNFNDTQILDSVSSCPSAANSTYTTPVFTTAGTYAYKYYYVQSGVPTLVQTINVVVNAAACANGLNSSYQPSCTCPSGQVQSGSICVAGGSCANGLNSSYQPSCTCPAGQVQSGSVCAAPPPGSCANGLNSSYQPSCTCPAGQTQSGSVCVASGGSCANGLNSSYQPSCTCPAGQTQSGSICVAGGSCANGLNSSYQPSCTCPAGQVQSGSVCAAPPPGSCANGLNSSYQPSCTCPAGQYQPLGSTTCVPLPVCANGLNSSYSPSCTCPVGQVQSGAVCVLQGVIQSFTANPNRVLKGHTATVTWVTAHMTSCSLTSLDSSGTHNLSSSPGNTLTPVISSQTIFTLTCRDASGASYPVSQTVNLVPVTIEQ